MPRGDKKAIMEFDLIVPTSPMISKYSQIVTLYYEVSFSKKAEIESLGSLRDTVLPKLLSGEIIPEIALGEAE